ncbi:MAG TPA: phenylalanine--tRNA ligase subunit beta [Alphaproteobacteria bacterium]|nr:phenylalanine--tRNA ligase subunit beta [Alphaproteobacteria bacterium]
MKFTLSWLKAHLETEASAAAIAERLTAIGLEVESLADRGAALEPFTVAYVVEARRHPNADKLSVCLVDTGAERLQVVCGAPNARSGMKGVFARTGSVIPGTGLKLAKSTIRGVESCGMLCSEREMGLSDDHDRIIELPADAPVGEPFASVLGLDDPLFDVAVTPNRADCLGVRGIARDLAAAGLGRLKPFAIEPVVGRFDSPIGVRLELAPERAAACPFFVGRTIRHVRNGESPAWLKRRLEAVGLRPISALVDITNYLTLDLARPAHVFDAAKIKGDLWLKLGQGGAKLRALDGREYVLDDEALAIGDDSGVLSLAGLIGGESSGSTAETRNVFLELATFDPLRTAATGRRLGIESDARYRFERGVDPAFVAPALEVATRLVLELCGGEPSRPVHAGLEPAWRRTIAFRPSRVASLGGLALDDGAIRRILEALGCTVKGAGEGLDVAPPSFRRDLEGEADLVEEVLRIHGYDRVPALSVPRPEGLPRPALDARERRVPWVRRALAARGLSEAVTWSFIASVDAERFGGASPELRLQNPIGAELDAMRPCVLPNLIRAAQRNADRGLIDCALFELGPQYAGDGPEDQMRVAAGVRRGGAGPRHWAEARRVVDGFDAKADALAGLAALGVVPDQLQVRREAPPWYHPGRSGVLAQGPKPLAYFGELHPGVLKAMDVSGPIAAFEIFLDRVPIKKSKRGAARPALRRSEFPAVERDFAFVVDEGVEAEAILKAARAVDKALIATVSLFDVYRGEGLEPGKKSVAVAVKLEPFEKTLTEAEIEAVAKRIVQSVGQATGAVLRA